MKTITEHNNQSIQEIVQSNLAGVLCDTCKVEMFYPNPHVVLACMPPKRTVQCPQCHKLDYKIG